VKIIFILSTIPPPPRLAPTHPTPPPRAKKLVETLKLLGTHSLRGAVSHHFTIWILPLAGFPIIVTSTQNAKVIAGHPITLQCGQSHQEITWYKDESAIPLARGQAYSIGIAKAEHEGTYYCAVDNGPRGSVKVVVIGKFIYY